MPVPFAEGNNNTGEMVMLGAIEVRNLIRENNEFSVLASFTPQDHIFSQLIKNRPAGKHCSSGIRKYFVLMFFIVFYSC
jgi:hypothetical protein